MSKVRVHSLYVVGFPVISAGASMMFRFRFTPFGLSLAKAKMKSTDRFLERVSTSELMKCKNKTHPPDYMLYLLIGCDISSFARSGYVNVACWIWIA